MPIYQEKFRGDGGPEHKGRDRRKIPPEQNIGAEQRITKDIAPLIREHLALALNGGEKIEIRYQKGPEKGKRGEVDEELFREQELFQAITNAMTAIENECIKIRVLKPEERRRSR